MYIGFNRNQDDKTLYISAKIEAVKHLQVVFLRTAEQRLSVILSPTSNQIVENYGLFFRHLKWCVAEWLESIF